MSILARSTRAPLGNSPARMRRNRSRFSSTGRSRNGRVLSGLGQRAAREPHLLLGLVVHIGLAGADQLFGPAIEPLEIVGRVIEVLAPVEAEPAHVRLDRVDIFLLFLGRVGVVEAQIAVAAKLLRDPEVEADRLGVPDMQVAVRLGRKACHHALMTARREVVRHDVADEIAPGFRFDLLGKRHASVLCPRSRPMWQRRTPTPSTRRQHI